MIHVLQGFIGGLLYSIAWTFGYHSAMRRMRQAAARLRRLPLDKLPTDLP